MKVESEDPGEPTISGAKRAEDAQNSLHPKRGAYVEDHHILAEDRVCRSVIKVVINGLLLAFLHSSCSESRCVEVSKEEQSKLDQMNG